MNVLFPIFFPLFRTTESLMKLYHEYLEVLEKLVIFASLNIKTAAIWKLMKH